MGFREAARRNVFSLPSLWLFCAVLIVLKHLYPFDRAEQQTVMYQIFILVVIAFFLLFAAWSKWGEGLTGYVQNSVLMKIQLIFVMVGLSGIEVLGYVMESLLADGGKILSFSPLSPFQTFYFLSATAGTLTILGVVLFPVIVIESYIRKRPSVARLRKLQYELLE